MTNSETRFPLTPSPPHPLTPSPPHPLTPSPPPPPPSPLPPPVIVTSTPSSQSYAGLDVESEEEDLNYDQLLENSEVS